MKTQSPSTRMDAASNQWIGNIRSLLHETPTDATKVIRAIQAHPNAQAREVAERYALEHFRRIQPRVYIPNNEPFYKGQIHYDLTTGVLTPLDGANQQICCLIDRRWDDLQPTKLHDMARQCNVCKRMTYKANRLSSEDVLEHIRNNTSVYLHLDPIYQMVAFFTLENQDPNKKKLNLRKWLTSRLGRQRTPKYNWYIHRVNSVLKINAAAAMGFQPVVEGKGKKKWFIGGIFFQVWQNTRTGEITVQRDESCVVLRPPFVEWRIACIGSYYDPQEHIGPPLYAYLIPADVTPGTRVYLSQRDTAIWNGTDLEQFERIPTLYIVNYEHPSR